VVRPRGRLEDVTARPVDRECIVVGGGIGGDDDRIRHSAPW
jgi:hypothetical protein